MTHAGDRVQYWIPLILAVALLGTVFFQVTNGTLRTDVDSDGMVTDSTLCAMTVIIYILIRKYKNLLLELGLALIIYTMTIHIVEELFHEFSFAELFIFTVLIMAGFLLVCAAVMQSRRVIDRDLEQLREQEGTLRTHAEELSALSAALGQANRKLRLLSQITRHDIANRLVVASGYVALALKREDCGEKNVYLGKIENAQKAIHGIISFTGVYEEIGLEAPKWQEVRPLIDSAAAQLGRQNLSIENDTDKNLTVYADSMLGKVFYNLIDNALMHGGERLTSIRFSSRMQVGGMAFFCEDNGCGIPDGEKERIFLQGIGKNTGLGLFLSSEILSITGITIRETGAEGAGARFEILVPEGKYRSGGQLQKG